MQIKLNYYKPKSLITVVGLCWTLSSWALSNLWGYGLLQGTGPSAIVISFIIIYDKWLWKLPIMKYMNNMPNLNGKYEGKISTNWDGKDLEKVCALEIKQTCSNIQVKTTFTKDGENETKSYSKEAFIKTEESGDQKLYFYYHNYGSCKNGDNLNQHDGMNILDIIKEGKTTRLSGHYFTNRDPQTKGCIELKKGDK